MGKIISVVSWKGGVGKTTSAVNISAYLQMQGKRVCAIDLDSQHNLSKHFGILPGQLKDRKTVYNLFVAAINECEDAEMDALVHAAIRKASTVDVIPATPKLTALESVLPSATCWEQLLQYILSFIKEEYDYIFLDCHPGSDLLTQNALTASTSVILPVEAHVLSSDGLAQEEKMIRSVRRHLNPDLQIEGILITKFQNQTNCCRQVLQSIVDNYGDRVRIFDEPIKYAIKVAEAPAFGISLHEYAPKCEAAKAYSNGNMSIFGMSGAGKTYTILLMAMRLRMTGVSGIPLGPPPYGYMRDEKDPNRWVGDEEAAKVIRQIDTLTLSGYGSEQIATCLSEQKILTPTAYAIAKGYKKPLPRTNGDPYAWGSPTIIKILNMREYCGDIINFKTYSISYKNKKRLKNDPEDMMVFEGVHEPIRDRATFEKIQEMRGKLRRRKMSNGEHNMFSGLLICADCGKILHYHFNQQNPKIRYFNCPNYNSGKKKTCFSSHYIRVDFLEQIVLGEIRRLTQFACKYEEEFTKAVTAYSKQVLESDKRICRNELNALIARDKELDRLFERIYEDNVAGKINDERFAKMSAKYEAEQQSIVERVNELKATYDEISQKGERAEFFVAAVRKYTRVKKLTALMLNELIEKIEVHQTEIIEGKRTQRIDIHYRCIGAITIPEDVSIPDTEITLGTRQGVQIAYSSTPVA